MEGIGMTQKGVQPTPRDSKLIRLVYDYGAVSSRQLASWFFNGVEKTTVLRRLRRLEGGRFIRKRGTLPDGTAVYLIGEAGTRYLCERKEVTTFPRHQLEHEIEINSVRWRLESLGLVKSWMTERALRSEIMRRNPGRQRSNLIVPDALILFRHFLEPGRKVQLELELHAKSDQRYRARLEKFRPTRLQASSFHWYLVRAASCGEKILRFAQKYGGSEAKDFIGYSVLDDFREQGLEAKLYRPGRALPLHAVFATHSEKHPAQGDAQGLSRVNQANRDSAVA